MDATIFHTVEWNRIITEVFGVKNVVILAKREGKPIGFQILYEYRGPGPRTVYRSPDFGLETVYGGPIVIGGLADEANVKKEIIRQCEMQARAVIIDIYFPPSCDTDFLNEIGYDCKPFYTSILSLEGSEEDLWKGFHQKTRNSIRKSQKEGVEVIRNGRKFLCDYYEMLKETLGPQGVRILPKAFYEKVLDELEPKNMAKLFIACHNGKAISGGIFLFYKDFVYYWHGASFKDYLYLSPNQLIQWELLKFAKENRFKQYDLLYIDPDGYPGIARFKMRFGGETKKYYRGYWKTPPMRIPVLTFYAKHPALTFSKIVEKIKNKSYCTLVKKGTT
jgi:hypothetical protein